MTNELAETTVQRDEWKRIAEDRGIELERLREVLTIPNITPDTTSSALFIRTLSEHEKGQPVNGQDLINALMWRVKNQRKEIARLQEKHGSSEPNAAPPHCPTCLCGIGHCPKHPAAIFHPPAACPECASGLLIGTYAHDK